MINKILYTVIIIVIIVIVLLAIVQEKSIEIKTFNLEDYSFFIDNFSTDETVGSINGKKDVLAKAEEIWIKKFGESVKDEKPYQAFYDSDNEVWLIQGRLKNGLFTSTKGGVANIIIEDSTGKVLAVWHEK